MNHLHWYLNLNVVLMNVQIVYYIEDLIGDADDKYKLCTHTNWFV